MDEREFRQRMVEHIPALRRVLRRRDAMAAEDRLHDALAWALTHWPTFDSRRGSLFYWLRDTVLRRTVSNSIRAAARNRVRIPNNEPLKEGLAGASDPDLPLWLADAVHTDDAQAIDLANAFAALPSDERAVALAILAEGRHVEVAAQELGISLRTCERRLKSARRRLCESLRHYRNKVC
jgi:RNA polymerase sigma factor (sigma-70 family)